jgi:hypothetical protein
MMEIPFQMWRVILFDEEESDEDFILFLSFHIRFLK